ncbi:helix-hairpin-helix domain-containing protein [Streptomyces sp. NPDC002809]|uniref:helix-hairpin-helix domain-containing protein n=1 Tax=Streptomyces sp. NPDC002809 TaxID=3154433 RepID=UPI00331F541E
MGAGPSAGGTVIAAGAAGEAHGVPEVIAASVAGAGGRAGVVGEAREAMAPRSSTAAPRSRGSSPSLAGASSLDAPGSPVMPRAAARAAAVGSAPAPPPAPSSPSPPAPPPASLPGPVAAGRLRRALPAVRERLPVWLQLRCGLEPKALAALTVVLVAAAVFAAMQLWSARPGSVRAPERVSEAAPPPVAQTDAGGDTGGAGAPEPSPGTPPAAGPGGQVVVDVSGKVRRPGIHRLPAGARVADALRVAGGARPGVDLDSLNRARVLMDGEQIVVGAPPGPTAAGGTGGGVGPTAAAGPVSLNTATMEQLETLPGVGPVLAQHIVDHRTQHGGFRSVDELREVNGIGDRRFADLQPLVRP